MEQDVILIERIDLRAIAGIYVTPDPTRILGIRMWCGYCAKVLHVDYRHMGEIPFLSLMVKMADAHRATECPRPDGPMNRDFYPCHTTEWISGYKQWLKEIKLELTA